MQDEDCGAACPAPPFPSFDELPAIASLNDPFAFANGTRVTTLAQW